MSEIHQWIEQLRNGDDDAAERAAIQLAGSPQASLPCLKNLLHAEDPDERWWALRTLALFPHQEELVSLFITALKDSSVQVQQCAALALCKYPTEAALDELIKLLSDKNSLLVTLAGNAIIKIGSAAVPALLQVLDDKNNSARIEAARILAELSDTRTIPALMKAMSEESALVQYWAEQGLNKMGLGMVYIKPD